MKLGDLLADRFLIQRFVGAGGMGAVFLALDRERATLAAVKVLQVTSAEAARRFAHEARVLADLRHPAIVQHLMTGEVGGELFFAMEWLEGEDLAARLVRSPLTAAQSIAVARRVADALAFAHSRGVVHRDVKPANVFLPGCAPERAKVLDFGIARDLRADHHATKTGVIVGTLGYLAPEQARGERDLSPRVDVFALGCVLLECLTGLPAFGGSNPVAILGKILVEPTPPLRSLRPDLPSDLCALVDRMLAKDPAARPADAGAVRDALDALEELSNAAPDAREGVVSAASPSRDLQFVTIALAGPEPREVEECAETVDAGATFADPAGIIQLAARAGATSEALADGSLLLVFTGSTVATDRAASAARVALALRGAHPTRPLAIATGRADLKGRLPLGEALDRAAALLVEARTDAPVRIDSVTAGLLGGRFDVTESSGELHLAGETPLDVERQLFGRPTPCVGRERELRMLEATAQEAFAERQPAAVLVVADAGFGKSRLERELTRRLRVRAPEVQVWRAVGTPLSAGSPLAMLASLLRRLSDIADDDPAEGRREKLTARVARHVAPAEVVRVAAFLGEIVGAQFAIEVTPELSAARMDPRHMTRSVQRAWDDFLDAETSACPTLFVLEDLHWGDGPTVARVDAALGREDRALFVLALARPSVSDVFASLWRERSVQELRLRELPRRACLELARHVLGDAEAPILDAIVDRASGHAFFLEEILRSVAARGAAPGTSFELPETVIAMLGSRFARLDERARRVLRAASVLGETFWGGAVGALLGVEPEDLAAELRLLVAEEMIERHAEPRFRGEEELAFRHALVREAAYATLPAEELRAHHLAAAAWLERAGEIDPRVLAEHHERGASDDAGWARAAASWNRAAIRAAEGSAATEAVSLGQRALAAVARIESTAVAAPIELGVQLAFGTALAATRGHGSAEVESAFHRAHSLAEAMGEAPPIFRAFHGLWSVANLRGRLDDAIELGGRCMRIAERAGRPDLLLEAHRAGWATRLIRGDFAVARRHLEAGRGLVEAAREVDAPILVSPSPESNRLAYLAVLDALTGFPARARAGASRARALAQAANHAYAAAFATTVAMVAAGVLLDRRWTRDCSESALAVSRERGFRWIEGLCLVWLGWAEGHDAPARGLTELERGLALLRAEGLDILMTAMLVLHAETALRAAQPALARRSLDEARAIESRSSERIYQPERLRLEGEVELHEGRTALGAARLEESIAAARSSGALAFELRSIVRLAKLRLAEGRGAESTGAVEAALARFTEGFEEQELLEARALLDRP